MSSSLPSAAGVLSPDPEGRIVLSVTELTRKVKSVLDREIGSVWVTGEVSNWSVSASGHQYFTLKDESSAISVVLFAGVAHRIRFKIEDGIAILVHGKVSIYEKTGKYQIVAERVEPRGIGPLQLAFLQRKEKLEKEGLFAPEHKKPLPGLPSTLAIVTSPTGAALYDMLKILDRRFPRLSIFIFPVRVQGEGAAEEIAHAIRLLNREMPELDVMIVGRGGGSLEDLWAFNEDVLARAIYDSEIPVVSAVGHEIDVTISDLVADRRARTPSEAAELVVPVFAEILETLQEQTGRLRRVLGSTLQVVRTKLDALSRSPCVRDPLEPIRQRAQDLDDLSERIRLRLLQRLDAGKSRVAVLQAHLRPDRVLSLVAHSRDTVTRLESLLAARAEHPLRLCRQRMEATSARLDAVSPVAVLGRGYSVTYDEASGKILRRASQVKEGQWILTRLGEGEFVAQAHPGAKPPPKKASAAKRAGQESHPGASPKRQPTLWSES